LRSHAGWLLGFGVFPCCLAECSFCPGLARVQKSELGRNFGVRWLISGWLESLSLFLCVDFWTRWLHLPVGAAVSFRWHGRLAVAGLGDGSGYPARSGRSVRVL